MAANAAGKPLRELVAEIIGEFAPEEQALLDALQDFDDETAIRHLTARKQRDERLGFGLETAGALVGPVVWIAVDEAVRRIIGATADKARASKRLRRLLPGRRKINVVVTVPPLTQDQLLVVKQSVIDAAHKARIDPQRSENIAESVVSRLVLAPPEGGTHTTEPS
jgi:hypothetical protein